MTIKAYQPRRTDLLINTTWGLPLDQMAESEVQARGLTLLQGRWVSPEERRRLKEEASAYRSLRSLAGLLLVIAFLSIFWTIAAVRNIGSPGLLVLILGAASLAGGIGLLHYARWGRNLAAVLFGLLLIVPFIPAGSDDKGGPFFLVIGSLGLYYLFRKTAGRVFKGGC
jgi:hypothetical protein